MTKIFMQLSLIFVLLSNGNYVNSDYINYINVKEKWIQFGKNSYGSSSQWYCYVTEQDIEMLKKVVGVYKDD